MRGVTARRAFSALALHRRAYMPFRITGALPPPLPPSRGESLHSSKKVAKKKQRKVPKEKKKITQIIVGTRVAWPPIVLHVAELATVN
jgi:hypothetical protein